MWQLLGRKLTILVGSDHHVSNPGRPAFNKTCHNNLIRALSLNMDSPAHQFYEEKALKSLETPIMLDLSHGNFDLWYDILLLF